MSKRLQCASALSFDEFFWRRTPKNIRKMNIIDLNFQIKKLMSLTRLKLVFQIYYTQPCFLWNVNVQKTTVCLGVATLVHEKTLGKHQISWNARLRCMSIKIEQNVHFEKFFYQNHFSTLSILWSYCLYTVFCSLDIK